MIVYGSGNPEILDATVNRTSKSGIYIQCLSLMIKTPGKGSQKVDFNGSDLVYDVTLTREKSGRSELRPKLAKETSARSLYLPDYRII